MKGKTALVTGSSRGIGRAIALRLADEEMKIIVNYRHREKEAKEVVDLIEKKGGLAVAIQADVSNIKEVEMMILKARELFGPIEVLVNNATIHRGGRVHKLSPEDWDIVIRSCLYGAYNCCHLVVPDMIQKGWGRIVNISSTVGERGYPGDAAYGAAKAGLIGFTKSLARELAPMGITVNAVMPGFVLTEMTQALTPKNIEGIKASIPLGRLCKPEEVAEMVAFIICKGDHITGSIHHVDGGIGI
jgi:3-oxoacyl-[acyl-carrier protein] reductase